MFFVYYVEVFRGGIIKWKRIVIIYIMFLRMNKENVVFNLIVWIYICLKEIMLFENIKEFYSYGGVCGWVRWERFEVFICCFFSSSLLVVYCDLVKVC